MNTEQKKAIEAQLFNIERDIIRIGNRMNKAGALGRESTYRHSEEILKRVQAKRDAIISVLDILGYGVEWSGEDDNIATIFKRD